MGTLSVLECIERCNTQEKYTALYLSLGQKTQFTFGRSISFFRLPPKNCLFPPVFIDSVQFVRLLSFFLQRLINCLFEINGGILL